MDPVTSYLLHLRRRNASPRTIRVYRDLLGVFRRWVAGEGIADLSRVTADDLGRFQVWLNTRDDRPILLASQKNHLKVCRSLYRWLEQERRIMKNPAAGLRYPKLPKRIHRDLLTPEELGRLLARPGATPIGLRDAVALRLLALSGLRVAELCALDLPDVDLQARELRVRGKGDKERIAFFDVTTRQILARYLVQARPRLARNRETALLVGRTGGRLYFETPGHFLSRYAKAARIQKHLTPHSLRRSFATLLLQAGCNLKVIAELMGHGQLATTAGYQKLDITELTRVYRQSHPKGDP